MAASLASGFSAVSAFHRRTCFGQSHVEKVIEGHVYEVWSPLEGGFSAAGASDRRACFGRSHAAVEKVIDTHIAGAWNPPV